jgi:hypothetical protein
MKYKINNTDQTRLLAGTFSIWLRNIRKALLENRSMDIPCGECDACSRSSYFIHIKPEETRTCRRIPKELLFPAPLRPEGHMVLGYDKSGRCPMLVGNKCSIYRNRPATCRIFDCRILAASRLELDDNDNNFIVQQARRWKFRYPTKRDCNLFSAVQDAATFLMRHPECLQNNWVPRDAIQISVLAIKVYEVFLKSNSLFVDTRKVIRDSEIAKEVLKSYERFERRMHAA